MAEQASKRQALRDAALIIVDVQNDFCPGGSLAVPEGDQVIPVINKLAPLFPVVVATQDWHPPNHCSFHAQGGPWPAHCVQGSRGAELHPQLDRTNITAYVKKGTRPEKDAYSGFEGADDTGTPLAELLRQRGIRKVYVAGLATDYCVRATVLDALKEGFEVHAVVDGVRAVNVEPGDGERALEEMQAAGARLENSNEILAAAGDPSPGAAWASREQRGG